MFKHSIFSLAQPKFPVPALAGFRLALCIGLFSGLAGIAQAAPTAEQDADWNQRLARAAELRGEAVRRNDAAETLYQEQEAACFRKFLVNRCRDNAYQEFRTATRDAKRLENEGKSIERQVKKEQYSQRDLEAAASAPERAAQLEAREIETAAARSEAELNEARTRADKERQAEEGARRKAEEAERLRKKQAEHEARVAEKMEKANAKAAAAPVKP
jgi:colicin import membrane protein